MFFSVKSFFSLVRCLIIACGFYTLGWLFIMVLSAIVDTAYYMSTDRCVVYSTSLSKYTQISRNHVYERVGVLICQHIRVCVCENDFPGFVSGCFTRRP